MKALTSLLAMFLMLSCASLAQTAPAQPTEPTQQTAPPQQTVAGDESSKPEAARPEVARPEAESQAPTPSPSPTASTPSAEAAAASVGAVLAAPPAPVFAPGAKLFIAPMDGFEQLLSEAILRKKVPVVLVKDQQQADFVMSGGAHVKTRGFISGWVLEPHGKGNVSITDARTGNMVFAHKFKRADSNLTAGWVYETWANDCAKDLKKKMGKK